MKAITNNLLRPQVGAVSRSLPLIDFRQWLEAKRREELERLQAIITLTQPKSIPFPNCLPQFGRHRWSIFAVLLPQGKISQCQFCFSEKLTPSQPQEFTQYFPPQTYYVR